MEQQEVEEISFLPGEAILNKKAVYEPSKGQRFRQIVCSRGWSVVILIGMAVAMIAIALIAAFARPVSMFSPSQCAVGSSTNTSSDIAINTAAKTRTPKFISTSGKLFPWKELRLPESVRPVSYEIFLHPNISASYFNGNVKMILDIASVTDFVVIHTAELNLTTAEVKKRKPNGRGFDLERVTVVEQLEYVENQQLYVGFGETMQAGTTIHLRIGFLGSLASLTELTGFYKSSYTVNGQQRFIASTQFESTYARKAFPCMDEPDLKATFQLSIVRDSSHLTLFNTQLNHTTLFGNGLFLDVYKTSLRMSTYLVAFVICDYKNISKTTKDGVMVRIYAPEDRLYMGEFALDVAVKVIEKYNQYFGIPYPLPKQDLIAIPNFSAGAMENWGLITFRDSAILYDPNISDQLSRHWVAEVVAHELAHQWFGNLVTMNWWNDLWLNEGFASFVAYIGTDTVDKDFHMQDSFMLSLNDALYMDSFTNSHPIQVEVENPTEISAVFDKISYDKGSCLIRMLSGVLGENNFRAGLTHYLKKYAYKNAMTKDLWDALQTKFQLPSGLTIAKVMDTWTKQMGYPVVTVTRQGKHLSLKQERFLLNKNQTQKKSDEEHASPFDYKWYVPFTYMTSTFPNKKEMVWMEMDSASVNIRGEAAWVKGNFEGHGFYRVNYDKEGWKGIIQQLKDNHEVFSVSDRVNLIDDVFSLARAQLVDYTVALDLSSYLVEETNYFVWHTATAHLKFIQSMLYLTPSYDNLQSYMRKIAMPNIRMTNWMDQDNYMAKNMQMLMVSLAVELEYEPFIEEAKRLFRTWENNMSESLNNALRSVIYNIGIEHGQKSDWDLVFQRYNSSNVPSDRRTLLNSLAYAKDARILQIFLEDSLDFSKIKSQDSGTVVSEVASNPNGHLLAWQFLREKWEVIYKRYNDEPFMLSKVVSTIVSKFNSKFQLDEVERFFLNRDTAGGKRALRRSIEIVQSHLEWARCCFPVVKRWLEKNVQNI